MKAYWYLLFIIVFASIYGLARLTSDAPTFTATTGQLDLRNWDTERDPIITLQGEWTFQKHLGNGQFSKSINLVAPGLWNEAVVAGEPIGPFGIGRYSLTLLLPEEPVNLGIELIEQVAGSTELRLNGVLINQVGTIDLINDKTEAGYRPFLNKIPAALIRDTLQIEVLTGNHLHRKGGFIKMARLGHFPQLTKAKTQRIILDSASAFLLFFFFLFNILLYFSLNREKMLFYFSLVCIAAFSRQIFVNDILFHYLSENLSFEIVQKVRYLGFFIGYGYAVAFFRELNQASFSKRLAEIAKWVAIAFSVAILLLPCYYGSFLSPLFQIFVIITLAYIYQFVWTEITNKNKDVLIMTIGGIIFTLTMMYDLLLANNLLVGFFSQSFGFLALILAQGAVIIRKFFHLFSINKTLLKEQATYTQLLEEKVQQRTLKLEAQNKTLLDLQNFKRNMTSMIVHDLKNPLSLILQSNQQERAPSTVVEKAGRRMLRMIENILDYYYAEEPEMQFYKKRVSVNSLFAASITNLNAAIQAKGVKVKSKVKQELFLEADQDMMIRVLENLLSNAIKFSPEKSSILLEAEAQGRAIQIKITDCGIGIPNQLKGRIFQPFETHDNDARNNLSFGLGLGFVKMVIDQHGGTIEVKDNPAGGTIFLIQLTASDVLASDCSPNDFLFSEKEQILLAPCIGHLEALEIYQISAIQKQLDTLSDSPEIIKWKKRILDSCYRSNQDCFQQLLGVLAFVEQD